MKSTVMDQDASEAEAKQFKAAELENRVINEDFEAEISEAKGEQPVNLSYETDDGIEADTQRQYAPSTGEMPVPIPRTLDDVHDLQGFRRYAWYFSPQNNYTPLHADDVQSVREGIDLAKYEVGREFLNANVEHSEQKARAKYKDYDRLIDTYVAPLIQEDRRVFEMLYYTPDPAESALKLARIIANGGRMPNNTRRRLNSLSQAQIDSMPVEQFEEWLRGVREGVEEDEVDNTVEISRAKMKNMNRLGLKDFERELERYLREGD